VSEFGMFLARARANYPVHKTFPWFRINPKEVTRLLGSDEWASFAKKARRGGAGAQSRVFYLKTPEMLAKLEAAIEAGVFKVEEVA
jgi:hypothetical protein